MMRSRRGRPSSAHGHGLLHDVRRAAHRAARSIARRSCSRNALPPSRIHRYYFGRYWYVVHNAPVIDHDGHHRMVRDALWYHASPAAGGVGALRLHRRPLAGCLRLRRLHVPDRRALGFRPGAAVVGREGIPEHTADVRPDHRDRLHRIVHRAGTGRTDLRIAEGSGRAAERRPVWATRRSSSSRSRTGCRT